MKDILRFYKDGYSLFIVAEDEYTDSLFVINYDYPSRTYRLDCNCETLYSLIEEMERSESISIDYADEYFLDYLIDELLDEYDLEFDEKRLYIVTVLKEFKGEI